jgi:hypothetical protein
LAAGDGRKADAKKPAIEEATDETAENKPRALERMVASATRKKDEGGGSNDGGGSNATPAGEGSTLESRALFAGVRSKGDSRDSRGLNWPDEVLEGGRPRDDDDG